jgi:dolichol-phosphate mannosyltransferase
VLRIKITRHKYPRARIDAPGNNRPSGGWRHQLRTRPKRSQETVKLYSLRYNLHLAILQEKGVLILLPVLNERQNIGELLERIDHALCGLPYTICILDDGSRDGTAQFIEAQMARPDHHLCLIRRVKTARGSQRGSALHQSMLWGLQHTSHAIFVEMDGDLSHRPEELLEGIRMAATECDVAIASKYLPGSEVTNRPWARLMVSRVCTVAVGLLITPRIRDYSNGYRFYKRSAAEMIAAHRIANASPIYLTEVLALWLRAGLRIREFKTTYIGRNEGISKLRFTDLFTAAVAIFEISWRYHVCGFSPLAADTLGAARTPAVHRHSRGAGR